MDEGGSKLRGALSLSVALSVCLSVFCVSLSLSICLFLSLCLPASVCLCVCLSEYLSVCLCVSVCLSVSLSLCLSVFVCLSLSPPLSPLQPKQQTNLGVLQVGLGGASPYEAEADLVLLGQVLKAQDPDVLLVLQRSGTHAQQVRQAGRVGQQQHHHEHPPESHHQPASQRARCSCVTWWCEEKREWRFIQKKTLPRTFTRRISPGCLPKSDVLVCNLVMWEEERMEI